MDAVEMIERYSVADGVIYANPPYLVATRSTMKKRPSGDYVHEFASEDDHRRLADVLRASRATVLLSGYHSPLYDELYCDWYRTERKVLRRTSNGRSAAQVHTMEVIWSNRPIDTQVAFDLDDASLQSASCSPQT